MKKFLYPLVSVVLAVLLAFGASYIAVNRQKVGSIRIGPWQTNSQTGSTSAGLYLRAWIALNAPWALKSSEVIYFLAFEDSQGMELDCNCHYRIEGVEPQTRWWSIAAYEDLHFIPNPINRFSLNSNTVEYIDNFSFAINLSPDAGHINWLPGCKNGGKLALSLRCYGPSEALSSNIAGAQLPTITKISCK